MFLHNQSCLAKVGPQRATLGESFQFHAKPLQFDVSSKIYAFGTENTSIL